MGHPDPLDIARDLLGFIDASPSPYHCVAESARRLERGGFSRLDEGAAWTLAPGDAHYVVRGGGSILAFRVGAAPAAEAGFLLAGAHTDSPNLRLKPLLAKAQEGYLLLDVEVYGGALVATWADRDLGLAGRVFVDGDNGLEARLLLLDRPLARVSNLAIHLDRSVHEQGLKLDPHLHLAPTLALWPDESDPRDAVAAMLAEAVGVDPGALRGHDVGLYDLQPGALGGQHDAFIYAARLDNQAMCHAALTALLGASDPLAATRAVVLFDHEEVGSESQHGAGGPFLRETLARIAEGTGGGLARALSKSFFVSADMAHAVHPSRADRHDGRHLPRLNGGPVVKTNAKQRYATDAESGALFRRLCHDADVPCQEFAMRADLPCGSTIGPISAARLGMRTVDVGNPMLSMHSAREVAGSRDPEHMTRVLSRLFTAGLPR